MPALWRLASKRLPDTGPWSPQGQAATGGGGYNDDDDDDGSVVQGYIDMEPWLLQDVVDMALDGNDSFVAALSLFGS